MVLPTNRTEFKSYILRRLGEPVIKVNVTDEQLEDLIDYALQYYKEYHYAGQKKNYYAHQITAADKTNGWIPLPESIIAVTRLLRPRTYIAGTGMWNIQYQWAQTLHHLAITGSTQDYWFALQRLESISELLNELIPVRFKKHENKLYLDTDMDKFQDGEFIVAEVYEGIDENVNPDIWKDIWLIKYTTALVKRQWGQNLKKFDQVQLPGGVILNGQQMFDEANDEILNLETEMITAYSPPLEGFIG